jgi:crossover junction endodeoxyribonuclease RuvC
VLEAGPSGLRLLDAGVIAAPRGVPLEGRLHALHDAVVALLERFLPGVLVVEDLYAEYRFPRTAILMGHARGVIYLAAGQRRVSVLPLAPAEVKRLVAANGSASKAQVQRGVQRLLGLAELPRPSHVADALGLAATGLSRLGTGHILAPAGPPARAPAASLGPR